MKQDTIETLSRRGVEVCKTLKASQITIMMQARDTDPVIFGSVLRLDSPDRINPFGDDLAGLKKTREAASMLRDWSAAHKAAERAVAMADFNRNPDFINGFLTITADGGATLYVHCGFGPTIMILEENILSARSARAA